MLSPLTAPAPEVDDATCYKPRWKGYICVLAFQCLIMVLPTLKLLHLFGVNEWSWCWITIPFWGPSLLLALLLAVERVTGFRKVSSPILVGYQQPSHSYERANEYWIAADEPMHMYALEVK